MNAVRIFILCLPLALVDSNCSQPAIEQRGKCSCCSVAPAGQGGLLATRFRSFHDLQSVIRIEYSGSKNGKRTEVPAVHLSHCSNGTEVNCVLTSGISQGDIWTARYDKTWKRFLCRVELFFRSPWMVAERRDLQRVYTLSRWRPEWFGEGDVAFYDIAKAFSNNINTPESAYKNERDSTEKGYLNSFNHIAAQAFITAIFSEKMADFIADAHERYSHPELITGAFTEAQINDLNEGPVDNYVDLINNEWGQALGLQLREKYSINRETNWTPVLLVAILNDMQSYFSWAFQIGFTPFEADDEIIQKFSNKLQKVMGEKFG